MPVIYSGSHASSPSIISGSERPTLWMFSMVWPPLSSLASAATQAVGKLGTASILSCMGMSENMTTDVPAGSVAAWARNASSASQNPSMSE